MSDVLVWGLVILFGMTPAFLCLWLDRVMRR